MKIYDFKVETIEGLQTDLSKYKDKVLLIVNTATKCGYTPQLIGLEKLHKKYREKGFEVIGFPCNQFLKQAPGTNTEILTFCQHNYGVTFDIFGKLNVKGRKIHPLYKYLVKHSPIRIGKKVKWNFEKFLINRNGEIVGRYLPKVEPEYIDGDIKILL
jgi:glutathione peroxidase